MMRSPQHPDALKTRTPPAGSFGARSRWLVLPASLLMGIGALCGAYGLLSDAEGLGMQKSWLRGSPFSDYTVPGLFLGSVVGGGMLAVAGLTWRRSALAPAAALFMGALLGAWLVIETAIIGFRGVQQAVLLLLCGGSALALVLSGYRALRNVRRRPA